MEEPLKTINQQLIRLLNQMWDMEEKLIRTEGYQDLTNNDMHVLQAIGTGEARNMSAVARTLNITVGSLTTSIKGLVRKKYVQRRHSERDRRQVLVSLTEKGKRAYKRHEDLQRQMSLAILKKLDKEELQVLIKTMDAVSKFSRDYTEDKES